MAVCAKTLTLAERDAVIHAGWVWVQKVVAPQLSDMLPRLSPAIPAQ